MSYSTPPRPRSRSAGRPGREEGGDRIRARPSLPSGPQMASSKSARSHGHPRSSRDKPDNMRTNSSSTSSSTTSGSSFLDRMKTPSSRTSLEDAEPRRRGRGGWPSVRGKEAVRSEDEQLEEEDARDAPTAGHGYDLWSRVTAVASNLTVNVSEAWQKSVTADGEETPPGQESRLTKAMKAYHLDRARSPADLPAWLFDEHERGVAPKAWSASNRREYEDRFLPDHDAEPRQRGGLRDVYDRAASSSSSSAPAPRHATPESGDGGRSRAADRLKAIRDAKRSAKTASGPAEDRRVQTGVGGERYQSAGETQGGRRPGGAGVGLPARPGRVGRQ